MKNKDKLNKLVIKERDYLFDYFAFKTLEKSYLFKINQVIIERIGYLLLRVSLGLYGNNIELALESYEYMSNKYFIHGTPTLFHSGTNNPQLLSCYLLGTKDSINDIYKNITDCAHISKWAGGIGIHISNIRSKNSQIRSNNGISNGIIPMLKVYNETGKYINQSGKRNGSIAVYLEPHHPDILSFLDIRKNHGNENERARDLFTGLWISDLFMEKVEKNDEWCLFDPDECPGLSTSWGDDYKYLYNTYLQNKKYRLKLPARTIWEAIIESQIETGTPYILYKDTANRYSNQKHLGTIQSSNLCAEIIEYSNSKEYACCTLASINLPILVQNNTFNFLKLENVVNIITRNLNRIIDINFYPIIETALSNYKHRPLGIGVQGLADVFAKLRLPFESEDARILNTKIFETIYYSSLKTSNIIAREYFLEKKKFYKKLYKTMDNLDKPMDYLDKSNIDIKKSMDYLIKLNNPEYKYLIEFYKSNPSIIYEDKESGSYSSFNDSPISKGLFQFDLHNKNVSNDRHNFKALRKDIMEFGIRNSLCVALMPTASTSQILGNNECFEPYTSNIYSRRTLAGDFVIINKYLVNDLELIDMWNTDMKNKIIAHNGSIQNILEIPNDIKELYKTAWEMSQKKIIQLAIDRAPFICQSQSMNLFFTNPNMKNISSALFYGWKNGLKTGSYYIRSQPPVQAQQFTISRDVCSLQNKDNCEACSA